MSFYGNFVKSNKSPREKWKDGLQALVDREFANASTYYEDVEEEIGFGTLKFKPINMRVNTLVDAKTGQRINDDYKKLIFPDLDYHPEIGTRYKFDNNIWIVYSTDNIKTDTSAVYVRRCNNTMNMQDEYGNIHREPCYIDYKVTENQIFRNYSIDVPSGRIWIQCQLNDYTKNINVNNRFIFGSDAYKIRERSRFDRRYTFEDSSVRYISFYADYDNLDANDNIELGIANYKEYNYHIESMNSIENIVGFSDNVIATVYLNDEVVNENIIWESDNTEIAEITLEGKFTLKRAGECSFIGKMANKETVVTKISVSVKESLVDSYKTILNPTTDYIKLNQTEFYSVYEYNNYVLTDTKFDIKCYDVPNRNYRFESDGNNFQITNLKTCNDTLLRVVYTNNRTLESKIFLIELGGIV